MVNRGASAAYTTLVKALARAFRWRRMLETGRYGKTDELEALRLFLLPEAAPALSLSSGIGGYAQTVR